MQSSDVSTKKVTDCLLSIKFDDIIIKRVKSAKYLGLTLDEHEKGITISFTKIGNSFKIYINTKYLKVIS